LYLVGGERINIEEGIWIDVLYPQKKSREDYLRDLTEEADENKSSLLLKVHYEGLTVLMTGDIGVEGEDEILKQYRNTPNMLDIDILKAGHHGSRFSTGDSFLDAVSPAIAVFQVGKNNYGHPHPTVIEKCVKKGIMVYRNDLNGAIIFEEEGETWRIKVLLPKNMPIKRLTRISKPAA
jgi:competence protein ComEC